MSEQVFYSWQGDDVLLRVHVQTRAAKTEISGTFGDALKIRVNSPPVDGKANAQLVKFIAKTFKVPKSRVELVSGEKNRDKCFLIRAPSVAPETLLSPDFSHPLKQYQES